MPLDRINGEVLDGLQASLHVVVEPRHVAAMNTLVVPYKTKNKKFGHTTRRRPLFDDAVAHAVEAFKDAGALFPVRFDETALLCQVYPKERIVTVTFQRKIAGEDHYVTRTYEQIPGSAIEALLAAAGKTMPRSH